MARGRGDMVCEEVSWWVTRAGTAPPTLAWVGALGRAAHGHISSIARSCKYRDTEEWNGVRGQERTLNMSTEIYFSGNNSSWWVKNRDTPTPPNRGGHKHENQLQTETSIAGQGVLTPFL